MNMMELIKTRKSVRTFDGRPLTEEDRKALEDYAKTITKIDLGIAICHFMSVTEGKFSISDPGITNDENIEYIATVTVD